MFEGARMVESPGMAIAADGWTATQENNRPLMSAAPVTIAQKLVPGVRPLTRFPLRSVGVSSTFFTAATIRLAESRLKFTPDISAPAKQLADLLNRHLLEKVNRQSTCRPATSVRFSSTITLRSACKGPCL
jgi:hypothetical protein